MRRFIYMKKGFTAVVIALTLFLTAGAVSASSVDESTTLHKKLLKDQALQSLQEEYPDAQFIEEDVAKDGSVEGITLQGPAPPLTSLSVYAAISTHYPQYEYFALNQLTSIEDHGGEEMYIVTREIGYSRNTSRIAQMNGGNIPMLMDEAIDLNGDRIIDGYFRWWDASGYENGRFTYQATSINAPWNTMSARMNIR
ncbi:MAG: DUF4879 domain-containing protein [Virgibacillus sp.]|nr:DUF4879 domain-containing protein [Virgibacillus sp.]